MTWSLKANRGEEAVYAGRASLVLDREEEAVVGVTVYPTF